MHLLLGLILKMTFEAFFLLKWCVEITRWLDDLLLTEVIPVAFVLVCPTFRYDLVVGWDGIINRTFYKKKTREAMHKLIIIFPKIFCTPTKILNDDLDFLFKNRGWMKSNGIAQVQACSTSVSIWQLVRNTRFWCSMLPVFSYKNRSQKL